jgi:hypothetical protein
MGIALVHLLATSFIIYEIPVGVIVVALAVVALVLRQRQRKPAKPAQPAAPQAFPLEGQDAAAQQAAAAAAQPAFTPSGPATHADPFAGFAATAPAAAPPPPAAAPGPASPPPGTPASWLPDPSGAPNTLRYWDGTAWTQHVAARS